MQQNSRSSTPSFFQRCRGLFNKNCLFVVRAFSIGQPRITPHCSTYFYILHLEFYILRFSHLTFRTSHQDLQTAKCKTLNVKCKRVRYYRYQRYPHLRLLHLGKEVRYSGILIALVVHPREQPVKPVSHGRARVSANIPRHAQTRQSKIRELPGMEIKIKVMIATNRVGTGKAIEAQREIVKRQPEQRYP